LRQEGRATLDSVDVSRQFALVPQDLVILSGSIAENIRLQSVRMRRWNGREGRDQSGGRLLHSVPPPEEYDTDRQARSDLSVGQRQRLTIARGIVKNAPTLMFGSDFRATQRASD
jgi:ABC-type multidrug transport system fused ATPase/permease subunit